MLLFSFLFLEYDFLCVNYNPPPPSSYLGDAIDLPVFKTKTTTKNSYGHFATLHVQSFGQSDSEQMLLII